MLSSLSVTVVSPGTLSTFSTVEELPAGFSGVAELSAGLSAVVFPAGDLAAELSTFQRHTPKGTDTLTEPPQGKAVFSLFPFLLYFCLNGTCPWGWDAPGPRRLSHQDNKSGAGF